MYADRYVQKTRFNPAGLTAAIAINAGFVAALMFSVPTLIPGHPVDDPLDTYVVPENPPPPPEKRVEPTPHPNRPIERILAHDPLVPTEGPAVITTTTVIDPPSGPIVGIDPGPVVIDPAPPVAPALIDPIVDPRYAGDFQPTYPAAERRAGREGKVSIRVLVGIDGRVKDATRLSATSDEFWHVTLTRALSKWRFKPGTRGGVPVEAWRTLSLTFVLKD